MKTLKSIITIAFISLLITANAQNTDSLTINPVQFTMAYPVASNGPQSDTIINNASFNLFFGLNGGLRGAEIGGLVNILNDDMTGCQIAGIVNINHGYSEGAQIAGIFNSTANSFTGTQIGGISNLLTDSLQGVQVAGLSNVTSKGTSGVQVAGIHNLTNHGVKGAQVAGIVNNTNDSLVGLQLSGIANVVHGNTRGAQITGIANVSTGSTNGTQISGIYNGAIHEMNGFQLSLINTAKTLNGFQLGLINVVDSTNGISIGLINIIRNGYQAVEISSNEVLYTNLVIKSGSEYFYNIYTAGIRPDQPHIFGFGLGLGSKINLGAKFSLSMEMTSTYINELEDFAWKVNLMNRFNLNLDYHINPHFALTLGPAFNVHVSELGYESTGGFTTAIAVNPFYTEVVNGYQVQMWVGVQGGVRFSF